MEWGLKNLGPPGAVPGRPELLSRIEQPDEIVTNFDDFGAGPGYGVPRNERVSVTL